MARIAGVNIPSQKRVAIGLRYIYGIGPHGAAKICATLGIPDAKRVHQLTDDEVLKIRQIIDAEFRVEGDLRRDVSLDIKRLIDIKCNRGMRHTKKLPVRGQRTRTNARTRKGKIKSVTQKKPASKKK